MISSFLQMMGFAVRKPEPTVAPVSAVADVNGDKPKPRSVKPRAKAAVKREEAECANYCKARN
jgi:hypothetical protein